MEEGRPERTLVLIKPDGVVRGLTGAILERFEAKTLKIVGMKLLRVSRELAERHYAEHRGKPFYAGLVDHITSGPTLAVALEGRSAVSVVRLMIGSTNPLTSAPGTIRGDYGSALTPNLVHASDSAASAERELGLFFRPEEYHEYERTDHAFA